MNLPPLSAIGSFGDQLVALMPRLRRFCLALCGSTDAGDDLMQAVLERALVKQHLYADGTRLDHWLFRLARNIQIDLVRARRSRGGPELDIEMAADVIGSDGRHVVEARSDLASAGQAFLALPENAREVFALVVLEGFSYKEAADLLEVPIGTVMSRIARARAAMESHVNRQITEKEHDNGR